MPASNRTSGHEPLYYFGARYYDPRTGVWESPDPALPDNFAKFPEKKDSSVPKVAAPTFLDLYDYADANPVVKTDPDGRQTTESLTAHVMSVLVYRYGYPVSSAAAIVGNLLVESGLVPNEIQTSCGKPVVVQAPWLPLRERDVTGHIRTLTPEEVRDWVKGKRGPMLGGVGIAVWTQVTRREGLFTHLYDGRHLTAKEVQLGVDPQVDYLVWELKNRPESHDLDDLLKSARAPSTTRRSSSATSSRTPASRTWSCAWRPRVRRSRSST